jgi:uncharacterized membrane-anchored protein YitT (DUF2179 family)
MAKIKEYFLINLGLSLVASGIHFFKAPNHFATGGVSGLAIIFQKFFPHVSIGPLMLLINISLLIGGFLLIGKNFGAKTIYSSFVLSAMVWILQKVFPMTHPFTNDTLLELFFGIILPAIGSGIVFNQNASTGGTDIVAKVLQQLTSLDIGKSLFLSDVAIILAAGAVFGVRIGMYSFFGLIMKAFLVDTVIESLNIRKQLVIISRETERIREYIVDNLHRGATIHIAYGAYHGEEKKVITTVVTRAQAVELRKFIRFIDPESFITITNSSEIIGNGFRSI